MRIAYTDQQIELRDELREYFAKLITPEVRSELGAMEGGKLYRDVG